jgi:hypothetical protein
MPVSRQLFHETVPLISTEVEMFIITLDTLLYNSMFPDLLLVLIAELLRLNRSIDKLLNHKIIM